jgi:hypothetical protein
MYRVLHDKLGRFLCIEKFEGETSQFGAGSRFWQDFLEWNAKQPVPLDLSDKPPEPPPVDAKLEEVKALVLADGNYTAAEITKVLNFIAKRALGI